MSSAALSTPTSINLGQQQPPSFPFPTLLERSSSNPNRQLPDVGDPTRAAASAARHTRSQSPRQADGRHMNTPNQGTITMDDGSGLPPAPENMDSNASGLPSTSILSAPRPVQATSEYRELLDVVSRVSPEITRQVMRDRWETCLTGSEYHTAFILNLLFASANPSVMPLVVQQTGERMVQSSKRQIFTHLNSKDMDELADLILAKASNEFLDKSMACRLETISARRLLNALARAERLGYNISDVVEENPANGSEVVVPSAAASIATPPAHAQSLQAQLSAARQASGSPAQMNRNVAYPPPAKSTSPYGIVHCTRCGRPCSGDQAFRYHAMRRACEHSDKVERVNVDVCPHCGCLFTSNGGLAYHVKSKVCGDYNGATEQAVIAELRARPRPRGNMMPGPMSSTPTPTPMPTQPTTSVFRSGPAATPGRTNGSTEDPYSKLTPEARRKFETEMLQAEERYGGLMRDAMKLPSNEREDYLQRIKNSFNSKQSTTRKKYGIRLRERRTRAEIEEERSRLLSSGPSAKRSRLDNGTSRNGTPLQAATPSINKVPVGGGLVEVAAEPELVDPTTTPADRQLFAPTGTSDDPMPIADDSSSGSGSGSSSSSSSSDGADDDIPARLPSHHFPA